MIKKFDNQAIEAKWKVKWQDAKLYEVGERDSSKEKRYVLVELPYPSGNLHIGHWYAFAVPDIYVRYLRMTGKQVIYPMGFDAFGLPAENAALKRDLNPREWTNSNIEYMRGQIASMGNAFSWDKTANTTDPEYYRWTQWMFTKFFANGMAYRGTGTVNWCPGCNTVIANEQVLADNTCERSGDVIEKKKMPQWMLKITDYADRLLEDLDELDWPEHIKEAQRQWIGKSSGAEIDFTLSSGESVTVFTTRPDTLYGATYMVLAPEHPLVTKHLETFFNRSAVENYIKDSSAKAEQDRLDGSKEKTGVKLDGLTATNPATGEEIPVFIADYVLASYGTGAIMAVPAHDERDYEFAQTFGLPIIPVVAEPITDQHHPPKSEVETIEGRDSIDVIIEHPSNGTFLLQREKAEEGPDHVHFVGGGTDSEADLVAVARELKEETGFQNFTITETPVACTFNYQFRHIANENRANRSVYYHVKLHDLTQATSEIDEGRHTVEWVKKDAVARAINWTPHQRAWELFLQPEAYTDHGIICNSNEFNDMSSTTAKDAITKKVGGRMTNTYRLRDWSVGRQRYWGVPIPIVYDPEGTAHVVPEEHLPWTLPDDVDFTPTGEPPLAKSKELKTRTEKIFGAGWTPEVETMDTFVDSSWYFLRYLDNQNSEALCSLEAQKNWMPVDVYFGGAEHTTMHLLYSRFWQKALYDLGLVVHDEPYARRVNRGLILGPDGYKMSKSKGNVIDPDEQVRYVGADAVKMYLAFLGPYEGSNYPWDTGGIAGIRRFLERAYGLYETLAESEPEATTKLLHKTIAKVRDDIEDSKFNTAISAMMVFSNHAEKEGINKTSYELFIRLLAPFAPFLTEEIWEELGHNTSVHNETYPEANTTLLSDDTVTIGVQVNGKHRGEITIAPDATEEQALNAAVTEPTVGKYLVVHPSKVIYVPGRILNLIVPEQEE